MPNGYRDNEVGNIRGLGNIPKADRPIAKQMRMAIALTPLFERVTQRNPDLLWVYYTSRDDFVYLYPRVSEKDYFDEAAHLEFDRAKRTGAYLTLALIDIDYFKRYNDGYGHYAGDKALQMVAESLSSSLLRASDKLFRVGGEEFALIATFQDPAQLEPFMNDL